MVLRDVGEVGGIKCHMVLKGSIIFSAKLKSLGDIDFFYQICQTYACVIIYLDHYIVSSNVTSICFPVISMYIHQIIHYMLKWLYALNSI